MTVMWQYVGPGFLPGIPARDLTSEDWDHMDEAQRSAVRMSGLYREMSPRPQEDHMARPKYERKEVKEG